MSGLRKHSDLLDLLDRLCEDDLDASGIQRIEQLVREDRSALQIYVQYLDLHGSLHWNAGQGGLAAAELLSRTHNESPSDVYPHLHSSKIEPICDIHFARAAAEASMDADSGNGFSDVDRRSRRMARLTVAASACLLVVAILVAFRASESSDSVADNTEQSRKTEVTDSDSPEVRPESGQIVSKTSSRTSPKLEPNAVVVKPSNVAVAPRPSENVRPETPAAPESPIPSDLPIVEFINAHVQAGWRSAEVEPSPTASDEEWARRIHLHLVGRIPTRETVDAFLADDSLNKRNALVDALLEDTDYVSNWTTVWANLLVGRSTENDRIYDRPALKKFLREAFAYNRPWNDVAFDLVTASGNSREEGAANFLVAHVNNQAVPATAIVSKVFLGTQIHCTQCHDHPFNDWTQSSFWELNSCFQQTKVVRSNKGKSFDVVKRDTGGPVYYENRQGVLRAAFPSFAGERIDPSPDYDRRLKLAQLMTQGDDMQFARAMVNRFWSHFMGYGFTTPVDDMGPHKQPSHPAVMERLAREFVQHNYDVKQLIRWITQAECYQLTSQATDDNELDDPEAGYIPAFSRVYARPMSPEQVYDSMLVATGVERQLWDQLAKARQEWLQQFVTPHNTDENDESIAFEGTVTQALLLMNGELTSRALNGSRGTVLEKISSASVKDSQKIEMLAMAALSRKPTPAEAKAFLAHLRTPRTRSRDEQLERLRDVFWAYLNSSEFVIVH